MAPAQCLSASSRPLMAGVRLENRNLISVPDTPKSDRRGSAHERGYTSRWQRARVGYLRLHPLCVFCQRRGTLTPASVVDHIKPHKGDKVLFWDSDNWQPLCKLCHDSDKARIERGSAKVAVDLDGNPQGLRHW